MWKCLEALLSDKIKSSEELTLVTQEGKNVERLETFFSKRSQETQVFAILGISLREKWPKKKFILVLIILYLGCISKYTDSVRI